MEGWLEKEGHTFKSWKRRYVVIHHERFAIVGTTTNANTSTTTRGSLNQQNQNGFYLISYYKDENKKNKCGEMLLTRNTAVSNLLNGHIPGRNNLFAVLSTENKGHNYLLLSAHTNEDKLVWMKYIQNIIDMQSRESDLLQNQQQQQQQWDDPSNHYSYLQDQKIEGWLEKEGQFIKSWKRRWMVFDPQLMTLSYYTESDSTFKKGEFKLSNNSTISPLKNGFSPGKVNLFVITSTYDRESILLSASSAEDRDRWLNGIQQFLLKHQKRQINFSSSPFLSFPVTEIPPCSVEDIRTIQMLYSDILTAPTTTTSTTTSSAISPSSLDGFSDSTNNQIVEFINQYFSEEYVEFNGSYDLRNKSSFIRQIENWWMSIPNIHWAIQDLVVDGNKVAVWAIISGSPSGVFFDLMDLDGSVSFTIMGLSIFTFVNSQIKSTYHLEDWNHAVQQLKNGVEKKIQFPSPSLSPSNPNILSISPSKPLPDCLQYTRAPSAVGDRLMSVAVRESSSFDFASPMFFPSPDRIRGIITELYTSCLTTNSNVKSSDLLSKFLAPDYFSFHNSSHILNRDTFLLEIETWRSSIPDMRWSIQDLIIDGNKVAVRLIVSGSPQGSFMNLNDLDGTVSFAIMALGVHVFVNNQIKCSYHLEDWESALSQIKRVRLSELSVSAAYSFCL